MAIHSQHGALLGPKSLDAGHGTDGHRVLRPNHRPGADGHGDDGRRWMDIQCRRASLHFAVGPGALAFNGAGIVINAGSATIINQNFGAVTFNGASTAGSANINNQTGTCNFPWH